MVSALTVLLLSQSSHNDLHRFRLLNLSGSYKNVVMVAIMIDLLGSCCTTALNDTKKC